MMLLSSLSLRNVHTEIFLHYRLWLAPPLLWYYLTRSFVVCRAKSPAKPTFYDEMICLLQEKLDDPNNYGTVADSQTTCFYQDPLDVQGQYK